MSPVVVFLHRGFVSVCGAVFFRLAVAVSIPAVLALRLRLFLARALLLALSVPVAVVELVCVSVSVFCYLCELDRDVALSMSQEELREYCCRAALRSRSSSRGGGSRVRLKRRKLHASLSSSVIRTSFGIVMELNGFSGRQIVGFVRVAFYVLF